MAVNWKKVLITTPFILGAALEIVRIVQDTMNEYEKNQSTAS